MQKINRAVKLTAVAFTVGGAMLLLAAPCIFTWAFGGKYDTGLTVLPGTLIYCIWFSMVFFANRYLMCAENAKAGSIAFAIGLVANIALNYFLAPRFGLVGVVLATGAANALALVITYAISWRAGMRWDRGIVFATLLPLALCLGGWQALAVSILACFVGWQSGWLFAEAEREALSRLLQDHVQRLRSLTAGSVAQAEG
jgi:O-antigen/teichoic acid export membrane protein